MSLEMEIDFVSPMETSLFFGALRCKLNNNAFLSRLRDLLGNSFMITVRSSRFGSNT